MIALSTVGSSWGFVGSLPQGALCIYAAGLSANSTLWRTSRATVTVALSLSAVIFDAIDSMSVFVSLLLVVVSPWADFGLCRISPERGARG